MTVVSTSIAGKLGENKSTVGVERGGNPPASDFVGVNDPMVGGATEEALRLVGTRTTTDSLCEMPAMILDEFLMILSYGL